MRLHPASIKYLGKGHPWITEDQYTEKFPKGAKFLIGGKEFVLLHDPTHKKIKARLWRKWDHSIKTFDFKRDLNKRIEKALAQRQEQNIASDRDNYYLIFGETDAIPGIYVQKIKGHILLQTQMDFWKPYLGDIVRKIREAFPEQELIVWWQKRDQTAQAKWIPFAHEQESANFVIKEYDINYQIKLGPHYDFGIYTDMAAIRGQLPQKQLENKKVLNLFAYTGAFSLFALKNQAAEVTSVDLSKVYSTWLEENIDLNPDLDKSKHQMITMPTIKALNRLIKEEKSFDLIICDPPSASSDGKKMTSAIRGYEQLMPLIAKLLAPHGTVITFINTHSINLDQYRRKMNQYIHKNELHLKSQKIYQLNSDCPTLATFPEGNYLKGICFKKLDK